MQCYQVCSAILLLQPFSQDERCIVSCHRSFFGRCPLEDALWFDLMTNRQLEKSLSLENLDWYNYATEHLTQISRIIVDLSVNDAGHWKPWKSGLLMCTKAVLRLSDSLLNNGNNEIRFKQRRLMCLCSLPNT